MVGGAVILMAWALAQLGPLPGQTRREQPNRSPAPGMRILVPWGLPPMQEKIYEGPVARFFHPSGAGFYAVSRSLQGAKDPRALSQQMCLAHHVYRGLVKKTIPFMHALQEVR